MNQVILIGNLVRDPEVRYTTGNNQTAVCNFSIAVNDGYGEKQYTSYIPIVAFGKSAENCGRFLAKGRKVAVHGRIQTGSYVNRDGQKVYTTEVIANSVEFLTPKDQGQGGYGGQVYQPQQIYQAPQQQYQAQPTPQHTGYQQTVTQAQPQPQQEQIAFGSGFAALQDDDIPF